MEKNENIFLLGLKLVIITACASLVLAFVFNVTKKPILNQEKMKNELAMKDLIENADTFESKEVKLSTNVLEVNQGKNSNGIVGYTIKMSTKGYSGEIKLMVGISSEGKVTGVKILSQSETPGLGENAKNTSFRGQFNGKEISKEIIVVKNSPSNSNEVQAITGATITSKAVVTAVNQAVIFYKENLAGRE